MQYDFLVFIGRFEPFHNGHYAVVNRALKLAKQVVILIGSANKPRTIRNPWNVSEREVMIRAAFPNESSRLLIRPLRDHLYNDPLWVSEVQRLVAEATKEAGPTIRIGVIGHHKDQSSYYLEMFPQWELVNSVNVAGVSASDLRDYLFAGGAGDVGKDLLIRAAVPEPVFAMLNGFRDGPQYPQLVREHQFIKNYRKGWASAPYEPTFVTVDAIVIHSGHVLLIRRRAEPGKGLWAFPGGFVDKNETLQSAVIRELREETRLKLPIPVLGGSMKSREVFDHPERSLRGRTITHAFYFEFPSGDLPPVKGGDDADHAQWIPISEAMEMEEQFFEDHFHILEHFLGRA
jgi:bifunctional NMN adenylyltransferase/nudix hydrolase